MINQLWEWAKAWEMTLNIAKCKIQHFGQKNPWYEYEMGGMKIQEAEEEKDLGIWINTILKPTKQCKLAAKMMNLTLGQIEEHSTTGRRQISFLCTKPLSGQSWNTASQRVIHAQRLI